MMMMMAAIAPPRSRAVPISEELVSVNSSDPMDAMDANVEITTTDAHAALILVPPSRRQPLDSSAMKRITSDDSSDALLGVLHPPCTPTDKNNYLVSFSTTVSEDVDDFVLQSTADNGLHTYCGGIWNCWEASLVGNNNNNNNKNSSRCHSSPCHPYSSPATNAQRHTAATTRTRTTTADDEKAHYWLNAKMIPAAPRHNHHTTTDTDVATPETKATVVPPLTVKRTVTFDAAADRVVEYPAPTPNPELYWNEAEACECRDERRALMQRFKQHIAYAPLVPWTEETESM
eukprot:scaffold1982_cov93-Amphora_coffeaeformis.AAC.52